MLCGASTPPWLAKRIDLSQELLDCKEVVTVVLLAKSLTAIASEINALSLT
ncbi:hypothetical protein D3C84_802790 [compost metagenome]